MDGKAAFRLSSAGPRGLEHLRQLVDGALRFASWDASAPIVVLKFVIRSFNEPSREDRAAKIFCWPPISFDRSCISVPSVASLTIAPPRSDWAAYL